MIPALIYGMDKLFIKGKMWRSVNQISVAFGKTASTSKSLVTLMRNSKNYDEEVFFRIHSVPVPHLFRQSCTVCRLGFILMHY